MDTLSSTHQLFIAWNRMTTVQTNHPYSAKVTFASCPVGEGKNFHYNASTVHTMQLPFAFPKYLPLLETALVSIRGCYWC
jgi:hypothetical protein